jgi:hypothetical protein
VKVAKSLEFSATSSVRISVQPVNRPAKQNHYLFIIGQGIEIVALDATVSWCRPAVPENVGTARTLWGQFGLPFLAETAEPVRYTQGAPPGAVPAGNLSTFRRPTRLAPWPLGGRGDNSTTRLRIRLLLTKQPPGPCGPDRQKRTKRSSWTGSGTMTENMRHQVHAVTRTRRRRQHFRHPSAQMHGFFIRLSSTPH